MTFSIVAVDKRAKEVGFAIASCNWDARRVCMAQAEVGAIASQASGNQTLLPQYFEKLADGSNPEAILEVFKETDTAMENRQIGMIALDGHPVAFTGDGCIEWAGHRTGDDFACQGNILTGPEVIDAIAETFESTEGPLYARLYAAIAAGEAAGGDQRGKQSAGLVIKKLGYGQPGTDTFIDFAIEDHADPVKELGRILGVAESLVGISMLQGAFTKADAADKSTVLAQLHGFLEDKKETRYLDAWKGLATRYHEIGDLENSIVALREYLAINPSMSIALQAHVDKGRLPADWSDTLRSVS